MKRRISATQREVLIILAVAFKSGQPEIKSTDLNEMVNKRLGESVHPNNFLRSCETLEDQGLIYRKKRCEPPNRRKEDLYVFISPEGFDRALALVDELRKRKSKEATGE